MKKSYQTSEFWFTLVSFLISGLFLIGVITEPDTKDDLINAVTHGVESIILIGGQFMVLSRYLKKREKEKVQHERTKQKEQDNLRKELEDYVGVDKKIEKVNINKASLGELIQLPHIGPAIAQKIIDYRKNYGDFQTSREIILVSGIANNTYQDIERYIEI
jgi:competence ComEA-like helix-hairpin-helix protein|tara:strand:- start:3361 stop:3843 length:483 start_codon:yes stop_codon:yes gene_type:complete